MARNVEDPEVTIEKIDEPTDLSPESSQPLEYKIKVTNGKGEKILVRTFMFECSDRKSILKEVEADDLGLADADRTIADGKDKEFEVKVNISKKLLKATRKFTVKVVFILGEEWIEELEEENDKKSIPELIVIFESKSIDPDLIKEWEKKKAEEIINSKTSLSKEDMRVHLRAEGITPETIEKLVPKKKGLFG